MLLEVGDIHTAYGKSQILFGVSLTVAPGEVVALMGRNGVGKSTTLRTAMGLVRSRLGRVRWKGEDITQHPTHRINAGGIAWVPEDRRIFPELTIWENLVVASNHGERGWSIDRVCALFPDLENLIDRKGGYHSGGQQQLLTIARALMAAPELILLDEPSEGLAPLVVRDVFDQIQQLRDEGISIVLAEQNFEFVLGFLTACTFWKRVK